MDHASPAVTHGGMGMWSGNWRAAGVSPSMTCFKWCAFGYVIGGQTPGRSPESMLVPNRLKKFPPNLKGRPDSRHFFLCDDWRFLRAFASPVGSKTQFRREK